MSATTRIKFVQPYAGWPKGAEHTVRLDVALALERLGTAQIVGEIHAEGVDNPTPDSPEPTPATVSPEPGNISAEILPGLREIRGIGPARERALGEAGIFDVYDLAGADEEELDAILDGSSRPQIARWIEEARQIVARIGP